MNSTAADLEYLQECLLIQDLANLEFGINKQASLFDDLGLDSIGSAIRSFVADHLKGSDEIKGGYFTSALGIMLPAILARVHPLLGVVYLVASQFGYDLDAAVTKIFGAVQPKLDAGQQITSEEVSNIGKQTLGISAEANFVDQLNMLIKEARSSRYYDRGYYGSSGSGILNSLPDIPFFRGSGSVFQRIFGNLFSSPGYGKSRIIWLLGGFAIWIVKTILAGAGMLALAEGVSHLLGHDKPKTEDSSPEPPKPETHPEAPPEPVKEVHEEPKVIHKEYQGPPKISPLTIPNSHKLWIVPLVGDGSVADTLRIWTLDLYRDLNQYSNINIVIKTSPQFNQMVHFLSSNPANLGKNTLVMPTQFSNRKQVVDQFIDDIRDKL